MQEQKWTPQFETVKKKKKKKKGKCEREYKFVRGYVTMDGIRTPFLLSYVRRAPPWLQDYRHPCPLKKMRVGR